MVQYSALENGVLHLYGDRGEDSNLKCESVMLLKHTEKREMQKKQEPVAEDNDTDSSDVIYHHTFDNFILCKNVFPRKIR